MKAVIVWLVLLSTVRATAADAVYASHDLLDFAERCLLDSRRWPEFSNLDGAKELKSFLATHNRQNRQTGTAVLTIDNGIAFYKNIDDLEVVGSDPRWTKKAATGVAVLLREFSAKATGTERKKRAIEKHALTLEEATKHVVGILRDPAVPADVSVATLHAWHAKYGDGDGVRYLASLAPAIAEFSASDVLSWKSKLDTARVSGSFNEDWDKQTRGVPAVFKFKSTPSPKPKQP